MEKSKINVFIKILAIVIICLISFIGIYVQKQNKMENIVKEYTLGEDLKGYREVIFELSDNTSDDLKNKETYEIAKSIIEKRLSDFKIENYNISLDKKTGSIYLQIPENSETDNVVSNIKETGKIEIKDSEDNTVLLDSSKIKTVRRMYNSTENGTVVLVDIEFNSEGAEILKDISSNKYATIKEDTSTNNEETKNEEEKESSESKEEATEGENTSEEENASSETENKENAQKKVVLSISGNNQNATSFDEPIENGILHLSMNNATTDSNQIEEYSKSAEIIASILRTGPIPVEYNITSNQYVLTDISSQFIKYVLIGISCVFAVLIVYMIIKHKSKGILATINFVGLLAIFLLILRYTNVVISLESIVGIALVMMLNYVFSMKMLSINLDNKKEYNRGFIDFIIKCIPIFAISVIFSFIKLSVLSTFGMTMVWGILLICAYNRLVMRNIIN